MELYVLRHGKAEDRSSAITSDSKRKLTEEGLREMQQISKSLNILDVKFDLIITSPLKRAKQTAEIVSNNQKTKKLLEWDELKPESSTSQLFEKLMTLKETKVLLVGHEPFLSSIIGYIITGNNQKCSLSLKKGGLAKIRISLFKPKISGELLWLLTPKQLRKLK